jgi:hypothetical protein
MDELVLSLLLTVLPITGNQVAELDFHVHTLDATPPNELYAYRLSNPFNERSQMTNFAVLCATLDWDATRLFRQPQETPDELRIFSACYLSMPASTNSTKFLRLHVREWKTNWTATAVEEAILKRLTIESAPDADLLLTKLAANPENARWTRWAIWKLLVRERRKAEAFEYAQREKLNTNISFSRSFPCRPFEKPCIQIFWPDKIRNEVFRYYFPDQKWTSQVVSPPSQTIYLPAGWKRPTGPNYRRSWKQGPSWQVIYSQKGNTLTRTATYEETDSCIAGAIDGNNYSESVIELTTPPKGLLFKAPYYIEVQ